jgi:hypothetical protein
MNIIMTKELMDFKEALRQGFNPELKEVAAGAEEFQYKLDNLRDACIYTNEYILNEKDTYIKILLGRKDSVLSNTAISLEYKIKVLIAKYTPNALTDSEVSRKLLELKLLESKLRFSSKEELVAMVDDYALGKKTYDKDTLNMIGSELISKDAIMDAERLKCYMNDNHIDDPWMKDENFSELQNQRAEALANLGRPYFDYNIGKSSTVLCTIASLLN